MAKQEGIKLISESRKKFLKLLLDDPRISSVVLINGEIPKSVCINDDGSVTFGLVPQRFINRIFRSYRTIEFPTLAFRIRNALAKYTPNNSGFKEFIKDEIVNHAIDSMKYDYVIDRLFMNAILGVTEGEYLIKPLGDVSSHSNKSGEKVVYESPKNWGLVLGDGIIPLSLKIFKKE